MTDPDQLEQALFQAIAPLVQAAARARGQAGIDSFARVSSLVIESARREVGEEQQPTEETPRG